MNTNRILFIIAMYNHERNDSFILTKCEYFRTGKKICTKVADGRPIPSSLAHCDGLLEDITKQYKHPEGKKLYSG